jgi:hypothetical protein
MTVIARQIAATPARTAGETWKRIVELITEPEGSFRAELEAVAGVAACIIADESPKESPIVIAGNGPRLRVYCVYGEDAVTGDDCDESPLTWNPTEGEWRLFLPCPKEDLEWVRSTLDHQSKRICAYDAAKGIPAEEEVQSSSPARASFVVNVEEFLKK